MHIIRIIFNQIVCHRWHIPMTYGIRGLAAELYTHIASKEPLLNALTSMVVIVPELSGETTLKWIVKIWRTRRSLWLSYGEGSEITRKIRTNSTELVM